MRLPSFWEGTSHHVISSSEGRKPAASAGCSRTNQRPAAFCQAIFPVVRIAALQLSIVRHLQSGIQSGPHPPDPVKLCLQIAQIWACLDCSLEANCCTCTTSQLDSPIPFCLLHELHVHRHVQYQSFPFLLNMYSIRKACFVILAPAATNGKCQIALRLWPCT